MVVIVIRVPTRETDEEKATSSVTCQSGGSSKVMVKKICENETGPPSYDSGVNIDAEPRDVKLFLRECRTVQGGPYRREIDHDFDSCSKDSGFGCYSECHRLKDLELLREIHERGKNEIRLESPASKDSGFSDLKTRPNNVMTIKCSPAVDSRASCTYLSSRSSQQDTDSNTVTYLSCSSQADPENSIATTKEEEWVTKKKVELTTRRQIETRMKRQVVLEDGKVVEDSGPIVTTNTTEDTEKQEHSHTEHRTTGDDQPGEEWIAAPGRGGLVKEVKERTVKSREETEERLETEDVQHLGDISDEGYMNAVKSGHSDVRQALEMSNRRELVASSPKIIHQSSRTKKIIDTQDTQESSEIQPDGKVITETRRTTEHEEVCDANVPDVDEVNSNGHDESTNKESFQRFRKTKEADLTEYRADGVKIAQKIRHQAETSEGERYGEPIDLSHMESLSTRLRKMRLRSQNHKLALEGCAPAERKDVVTKRPLNFDQEEETRKVETSKWLEHHFGSESTKSSKGSVDDLADITPSNQNSFINVTMTSLPIGSRSPKTVNFSDEDSSPKNYCSKTELPREVFFSSPECESPTNGGYFRGISHWDDRRSMETRIERNGTKKITSHGVQPPTTPPDSPPLLITSRKINPVPLKTIFSTATVKKKMEESPMLDRRRFTQTNGYSARNSTPVKKELNYRERTPSPSPIQRNLLLSSPEEDLPSPPARRKQKDANRINYNIQTWDKRQRTEEKQNYVTDSRTPSPVEDEIIVREEVKTVELPSNKKLYQRTRFAADIPPPQQQQRPAQQPKQKSKIGESFRKFVGKLRSSSTERKTKKRNGKHSDSRSPSPRNSYQNYSVVDNNIPSAVNRVGRDQMGEPVAPPRGRPSKSDNGSLVDSGTQTKVPGEMERKLTQRYYLGENPFSGSIYGREREYDGVVPMKSRSRQRAGNQRKGDDDAQASTLGRLSKSTSRLISSEVPAPVYEYDREVQTLPRKLRNESNYKRPVEAQRSLGESRILSPNHWQYGHQNAKSKSSTKPYSGSMINVSFVNHVSQPSSKYGNEAGLGGPAKPARTYRSNLSRSKSFNVQVGEGDYKPNPQLHRLEESPEPLKSPGIISSLNRSSRDITEDGFLYPKPSDDKRKMFMKGLMERAPELFRTLHGDEDYEPKSTTTIYTGTSVHKKADALRRTEYGDPYRSSGELSYRKTTLVNGIDRSSPKSSLVSTPSFQETSQDGNATRSVMRRGSSSNDDYSETVRITSKSDDPLRPSETNTVQTFSKKTIPSKNGLSTETIESSETKTIVKSRYLGGDVDNSNKYYRNSPGGVTIEVRNSRK